MIKDPSKSSLVCVYVCVGSHPRARRSGEVYERVRLHGNVLIDHALKGTSGASRAPAHVADHTSQRHTMHDNGGARPQKKSRIDPKEPFGIRLVIRLRNVSGLCRTICASVQGFILVAVILISDARTPPK